jgi:hypothetical protein
VRSWRKKSIKKLFFKKWILDFFDKRGSTKIMENNDRLSVLGTIKVIVKEWNMHDQLEFYKTHAKTSAGCCGYFNFFECPHTTHDELVKIYCAIDPPPDLVDTSEEYVVMIHGDYSGGITYTAIPQKDDYVERVTSLLHNVSRLSTRNKLMTESLLNHYLIDFAALLVSKRVDEKSLSEFEANVAMALDPNSPLSIVFQKAELIRVHREIVFGILGLPLYSLTHEVASPKVCALLKIDTMQSQIFENFLKKL